MSLCVSIAPINNAEALAGISDALLADRIELRIDRLRDPDLARILSEKTKPLIIACPQKEEGGYFEGTRTERAKLLFKAAQLGAAAVDIDYRCVGDLPDLPPSCQRIVSYHDFKETPSSLSAIEKQLRPFGDIVKIVTTAQKLTDNAVPLNLLENSKQPTISFAMGEPGRLSRVLAPLFGSVWTYASLVPGKETAPGQLSMAELRAIYPPAADLSQTAIFGIVGYPLSFTLSPAVHNAGFRAQRLNAVYLQFPGENFQEFAKAFRSTRFRGFSITHPYKEAALGLSDQSDPHARSLGASNTWVRLESGAWQALNTDGEGGVAALEKQAGALKNRLILILGTGGAARALAFEAKRAKAEVVLAGRDEKKTTQIANLLGVKSIAWEKIPQLPYDILIHATPVGMFPNIEECCIPSDWIRPGSTVMDIIYKPRETKLLRLAKEKGAKTIGGIEMFLEQAERQFRLFTNSAAPAGLFRAVAERWI